MRIVIASPPKTGNSWLKCLLATIYDLQWLTGDHTPERADVDAFRAWVERGAFPDRSIYHQHYDFSDELCDLADAVPARITTIVRDPYDQFVSLYFFVQAQGGNAKRAARGRAADVMLGKPIDHPDALAFLADDFNTDLQKGLEWLASGRTIVVRYEELHRDPLTELARATSRLSPVEPERIERAAVACEARTLLKARRGLSKRIRSATVGDWQNHLTPAHLAIFRDRHADLIRSLGYEVR